MSCRRVHQLVGGLRTGNGAVPHIEAFSDQGALPMKCRTILPALFAVGLLCLVSASNASAFELLNRVLAAGGGAGGCGCESVCGCDVAPTCGCDNGCKTRCHRERCHRERCGRDRCHRDRCNNTCGCEPKCAAPAPVCGCEPKCGCDNGCKTRGHRCHRNRCGDRCGRNSCGCEPKCGAEPTCAAPAPTCGCGA